MIKHLLISFLTLSITACSQSKITEEFILVDENATNETKALFANLIKIQEEGKVLFGQQDATLYGREWMGDEDRSDVKDVTGKHPALLGIDLGGIESKEDKDYFDRRTKLLKHTKETYARGGVVTFSWHMANPNNGGSFYWKEDSLIAVPHILPNGKLHDTYKSYLANVAEIASEMKGEGGELIPIIFRPYHEYDGDWFWWGKGHCTRDEFVQLWKFTVDYLKEELKVRNFLYVFSPDCRFQTSAEYLEYYPGDAYVDILGMDNYWDFRADGGNNPQLAKEKLQIVSNLAKEKNKVAALTETGLEGVTDSVWFTKTLLPILSEVNIAYVQVWRNAYKSATHYYMPTNSSPAAKDFKEFSQKEQILFDTELPDMYEIKRIN